MQKVFSSDQKYVYRTPTLNRIALFGFAALGLALAGSSADCCSNADEYLKWIPAVVSYVIAVIGLVGGLYSDSFEINFTTKTLCFKRNWANVNLRNVTLDFGAVRSLKLISSKHYVFRTGEVKPFLLLFIVVESAVLTQLQLSAFHRQDKAVIEAQTLADKLGVSIVWLGKFE